MKLSKKSILLIVVVIELFAVAVGIQEYVENKGFDGKIERPKPGSVDINTQMTVTTEEYGKQDIDIRISPQKRGEDEINELFNQAKDEIDKTVCGNNEDLLHVRDNLVINNTYCNGLVLATWKFDDYTVVDPSGKIIRDNVINRKNIKAYVTLSCENTEELYIFGLTVYPPDVSTKNGYEYLLNKALEENNLKTSNSVKLPSNVDSVKLIWKRKSSDRSVQLAVFGIISGFLMIFAIKNQSRNEVIQRKKELDLDYPEIVSMLSLYVGAGISVKSAFTRIANDYCKRKEKSGYTRPGYEGIVKLKRQIEDGKGEMESYKDFGKYMEHKDYRKLSMIIIQNIRKGTNQMIEQLEKEEQQAFEERKLRAKIAGEEASTKMLLPMMGLLAIVLVVLLFPAISGISV